MTNQITKHCHYVPRVYLKNFADKNKRAYCLMKKDPKNIKRIKIDNICNEKYMYARENADGTRDLSLESVFSSFEETIPSIISEVENTVNLSDSFIDAKLKNKLIQATILQLVRGQQTKNYIDSKSSELYHQSFDEEDLILKYTNPKLYEEIKACENRIIQNTPIDTIREYLRSSDSSAVKKMLQMMQLKFLLSPDAGLVTSDQPVVLYNIATNNVGLFKASLARSETIVYYPLTPHIAITFFHKNEQTARKDSSLYTITEDNAIFLNKIQYRQSSRYIISKSKSTLGINYE